MTRRRHTPDQIIRRLAEGNKLLAGGAELDEVCRHFEIAESTLAAPTEPSGELLAIVGQDRVARRVAWATAQ